MANTGRPPASLSTGDLPSSFDSSPEFFDESRSAKLFRKIRQEPLIPIGCLATCYALYQATKSIRAGDHHQTNRMFRARIYAQGFTLVAIVAGSIFYQDERMKRKGLEKETEKLRAVEKRDRWLAELEARDAEDRAWRERVEGMAKEARESVQEAKARVEYGMGRQTAKVDQAVRAVKEKTENVKDKIEQQFSSKSMSEEILSRSVWSRRTLSDVWTRS